MKLIKLKIESRKAKEGLVRLVVLCIMLAAFPFQLIRAQTFSEWFRQKKTQQRYLLEQIAALRVYAGYVHKGYGIVSDGLQTVRDITNVEFNLHGFFISGVSGAATRNPTKVY